MALYSELRELARNDAMRNRISAAIVSSAYDMINVATTDAELIYPVSLVKDPDTWGKPILFLVIAKNKSADASVLENASDATMQSDVDDIVAKLAPKGI